MVRLKNKIIGQKTALFLMTAILSAVFAFSRAGAAVVTTIPDGYTVTVEPGMTVKLPGESELLVQNGGTLVLVGTSGAPVTLTNLTAGRYALNVNGVIRARHAAFNYTGTNGVYVGPSGTIGLINNFSDCSFQNGAPGGVYLKVENAQDFRVGELGTISGTSWASGASYNVSKTADHGYLQFLDYSGTLSGESHDLDSHNRILWGFTSPTPTATLTPTRTPTGMATATATASPTLSPTYPPMTPSVPPFTPTNTPTHSAPPIPASGTLGIGLLIMILSLGIGALTKKSN